MKKLLFTVIALLFCATAYSAEALRGWTTDINAALAQAKKTDRPVLILFTGSDWCSWCKRLKKDTLDRKDFQKFAEEELVLVYYDFPSRKKIDAGLMSEQQKWQKKFGVRGYPTTIIVDAKGNEIGRISGYAKSSDYIKKIKACLGKKSSRKGRR